MPRSKFINYRHRVDKNDNSHNSKREEDGGAALPIRQNEGGESAPKNRFHPYHRYKRENERNWQQRNTDLNDCQYFTVGRLAELGMRNSDECVGEIAGKKAQFDRLLNGTLERDILVATVQVLANVCSANFVENVTGILSRTCSATFLKSLESYLTTLPFESSDDKLKNQLYWENKNRFWNNLVTIFEKLNKLFPSKARDELATILGKIISIITSTETNQDYKIDTNVKESFLKMHDDLREQVFESEAGNEVQKTLPNEVETEEPFENFRSLSVIPTIEDLADNHPFIRPSKHEGAYDSVEQYLDIQYRLLREDFVSPLRDGLNEYLQGQKSYRNSQLRVYKNVRLLKPGETSNNPGLMVSFGRLRNVDWKNSKRFLFGSLVCLSSDNFNSILFATVANRDENLLKNGTILIEPCNNATMTHNDYDSVWAMLESKIYFEPYLVVLKAMCHLNEGNFPMKKYLIDADKFVSLPRYLGPEAVLSYQGFSLPMGENETWPTPEDLKLDESQYEAFKSALCQEFAIIQGPPGTGKTFIALEIIRTLLENKSHWRDDGPIVIVCLTNHALDQFLEGILKCTRSIVRIGRRSKSKFLSKYTLVERKNMLASTTIQYRRVVRQKKFAAERIQRSIKKTRSILEYLTTKDAVVPLSLLHAYCNDIELQQLKNCDVLLQSLLANNSASINTDIVPGRSNIHARIGIVYDSEDRGNTSRNDESLWSNERFNGEELVFLLKAIDIKINDIQKQIDDYKNPRKKPRFEVFTRRNNPVASLERNVRDLELQRFRVQDNLSQHPILTPNQDISRLNSHWRNYWKWVKISHEKASHKLTKLEEDYRQATLELQEAKQMVDLKVLRDHDIVGFTTTAAARLHASIRALDAPIVLVEEAAEILESHVVCSLTKSCQHVILIGDHKQLRPKIAVHKLGTKYNLNVSLFERMVNIREGACTQLAHQHRMRPEIAKLICPSIYETLHNHKSVIEYPSVMGVEKNVFFLNHKHREESLDNQDTWINPFEAEFLVAFARHLILQGYQSTEITILCTYTGQLFTLMKERKNHLILKDVRITTVDNYQGEENRIILLSLVRNNKEGNIGFLKEENRVCVALSRAREGLYILGNMENLSKKNDVWPKIKEVLENSNAIGDSLELRCQFHPDRLINVQTAGDFDQCPEGGCSQKCNTDLPCGHPCISICHTLDRDHLKFTCEKPCVKKCPEDHPCPLLCYQECGLCQVTVDRQLKCGHTVNILCGKNPETYRCPVKVNAILPQCKHPIEKACHESLDECCCSQPCEIRLPCGHSCDRNCHVREDPDHLKYVCRKPCSKSNRDCTMEHPCKLQCHEKCKPCTMVVSKKRSCGHERQLKCSENVDKIPCYKLINHERRCGHKISVRCHHKDEQCEVLSTKISTCGHKVLIKCYQTPNTSDCYGQCKRVLPCGHLCTRRCKDPCLTECEISFTHTRPGLCGHIISVPCHLKDTDAASPTILQYCKEPCTEELACGHRCKGSCGSCKQGRIHIPCGEKCGHVLICGHECDVSCRQDCPPCQKPCQVKCVHSRCNKKCGEPCVPCMELCAAGCRHSRCINRCYELCVRKPCKEHCRIVLKCGHKCIGFCGDPCPKLCRICDKVELMEEFFLGNEEEPNARFVLLEDCGHCIESQGLLQWISQSKESIQMKTCPRCKTPISKCMRIMNQIKTDFKDIQRVKLKIFGDQTKLRDQQSQLLKRVKDMESSRVARVFQGMKPVLVRLHAKVTSVTKEMRQQTLNARAADAVRIVLDILDEISETYGKIKNSTVKSYTRVKAQINLLLESLPCTGRISEQEINDIKRELKRLEYMAVICMMESKAGLDRNNTAEDQTPYDFVIETLVCIGKFSETIEKEIVKELEELRTSHHKDMVVKNERKMIVKAMGFSKQGHWYKCPNGHIYSIGECGGAMQVSKCNECGSTIGGQSHRLTSTNSVANEMDGATRPAWP